MADAVAVLRANGILIPEVMIRAAQLETVELAVAATILQGESGGGKHIWGSDGVSTGGAYVKGGPVTRENYLRYRELMRAGKIGRQGVAETQATSAQYQDTADALGGCWDPLANCRSGFRGMGALIKAYGVRNGARRYNGSGTAAEAYADRFMGRYNRWRSLLAGAPVPNVSVPAAAAPVVPPRPKVESVIQNFPVVGSGVLELNTMIKGASGLYGAAFLSARAPRGGKVDAWWGMSGAGGRGEAHWTLAPNARRWTELTGGDVDQTTVHYDFGAAIPGVISVEFAPK